MKTTKLLLATVILIGCTLSCEECPDDRPAACDMQFEDLPQETCLAYWESWFYNDKTNSCEFKGYSGCSPSGFESKEECEACKCN